MCKTGASRPYVRLAIHRTNTDFLHRLLSLFSKRLHLNSAACSSLSPLCTSLTTHTKFGCPLKGPAPQCTPGRKTPASHNMSSDVINPSGQYGCLEVAFMATILWPPVTSFNMRREQSKKSLHSDCRHNVVATLFPEDGAGA
jgi:hypothetical protein